MHFLTGLFDLLNSVHFRPGLFLSAISFIIIIIDLYFSVKIITEAVVWTCSVKKMFFKI